MKTYTALSHDWNATKENGINSKPYVLNLSHNSTEYSIENSVGVSELSTFVDHDLVEQHSSIVEKESIISVKDDAFAFSGKDLGNSLHFYVDDKAGGRVDLFQVNGIEVEQYVVSFSDQEVCSQAKKLNETERLANVRHYVSLRELALTLSLIRNLKRLPVRFPKPMVKMKQGEEKQVAWLYNSLRTRNLKGDAVLQSQNK